VKVTRERETLGATSHQDLGESRETLAYLRTVGLYLGKGGRGGEVTQDLGGKKKNLNEKGLPCNQKIRN